MSEGNQRCNSSADIWKKISEISTDILLQSLAPLSLTHRRPLQSSHAPILHKFPQIAKSFPAARAIYASRILWINQQKQAICPEGTFHVHSMLVGIPVMTGAWLYFCWEEHWGHLWRGRKGQAACLLQSKMINSGWEMQRKQRGVLPTSALLNLYKLRTGGVYFFPLEPKQRAALCWRRLRLVPKAITQPSVMFI